MFTQCEAYAKSNTEHAHQVALMMAVSQIIYRYTVRNDGAALETPVGWFAPDTVGRLHMLFAIPNGGERNSAVAARLKAEGVKSGVPDLCWPVARSLRHGSLLLHSHALWIEMKRPGKLMNTSNHQDKWHASLVDSGSVVIVRDNWRTALTALCKYSNNERVEYRL